MPTRYAAVIGPGESATTDDCAIASEVGRLLAVSGVVVVTGGLGGVMAAATAGCEQAGGTSLAILPGARGDPSAAPERSDDASAARAIRLAVPSGLSEMRNALVIRSAEVVIAVGGSWGTLSEIALARRTGVPVVCVGGWSVLDGSGTALLPEPDDSAQSAVDRALELLAPP